MSARDPAAARFFALVAIRFTGAALALFGAVIVARRIVEPAELVGGILMVVGAFDVLVLPTLMARRWRSK